MADFLDYKVVQSFKSGLGTIEILEFKNVYFISNNGSITYQNFKAYSTLQEAQECVLDTLQNTREEIEEYIANNV